MIKLNAKQLRTTVPTDEQMKAVKKNPIYLILDNVLDTYNIGSVFRLADAVAAEKVFLCGETLTPPHTRIKKASINTTEWVEWEYCKTATEAIEHLRSGKQEAGSRKKNLASNISRLASVKIVAVEQDSRSIPYTDLKVEFPMAIVVGNETYGVNKEVLEMADEIVELPMFGVNKSLNVMVSLGIVLFEIAKKLKNN